MKHFSVQINDLPPSIQKDLDEHAHFKKKTGLYEMDSSYLSEWYCTNAEKNIGKKIAILKFIASTEKNEKKLVETNNNLAEVKKYVLTSAVNINDSISSKILFYISDLLIVCGMNSNVIIRIDCYAKQIKKWKFWLRKEYVLFSKFDI